MPTSAYADAVREAIAAEMRAQPRLIVFAACAEPDWLAQLRQDFSPERIRILERAMPLGAFLSAASGAARLGAPVLVQGGPEVLNGLTPALGAALRGLPAPLVLRIVAAGAAPIGAYARKGQPEPTLDSAWLIGAPSTPADAAGLLRGALRQECNPRAALLLESHALFAQRGSVPARFALPFGSGVVRREGRDVSLATAGPLTGEIAAACETLAAAPEPLQVEVLDLRSLQPLDVELVAASLRKTGRMLLCPQPPLPGVFCAPLLRAIHERAFDELDAPVRIFDGFAAQPEGWREPLLGVLRTLATE